MRTKILLALGLIVNCAGRCGVPLDVFDKLQSLSFMLFLLAGWLNDKTRTTNIAWVGTIILCAYNLFDEFYGDPIHMTLTELVTGISIVILTITVMIYER